jgi:hypothetical protein
MKRALRKEGLPARLTLTATAVLLLVSGGCTTEEAGMAAMAFALDFARQVLTFWLL